MTSRLSFAVQKSFSGFGLRDPQSPPNHSFQRNSDVRWLLLANATCNVIGYNVDHDCWVRASRTQKIL